MPDLRTSYLGLKLKNPLVVSANPLSEKIENILRMEDAGASAVVLYSLFEEQIKKEAARVAQVFQTTSNSFSETSKFFPLLEDYEVGTGQYLEIIRKAKEKTNIPIIASLNGITPDGWTEYAMDIEQAGADALEVNVYFIPGDIGLSSLEVESRYLEIIKLIKQKINIPISVKLNPYFSSTGNMANQLHKEGAEGLVLFNRFYQPDFDIDNLKVLSNLEFSTPSEIRLPLLWIAMIYGRVPVSLAATTGVHGARELIKFILAGADVAMVASALYTHGIEWIKNILEDLEIYMEKMGFDSIHSFKGLMSQQHISDPTAYERSNYIHILEDKTYRR